ncbi:MAG: 23S rRNA (uracil(1939)-C(5))-methyltransferase RlmD, partial [Oscillospiraceae bacterium]|nr:23S rRNA (uracil(1939)-C(5))-methyltransferase RlmD [Oscillospiraceae bacterium]
MSVRKDTALLHKNQIIPIEITGMTAKGQGVGRFCNFAVFTAQAVPGDVLEVRIVKVQKTLAYAIIERIVTPSPDRTEPECRGAFPQCGGCAMQHITYEAECRIKAQIVSDAFTRIGHLTPKTLLPIFSAEEPRRYRNKAQYPCGIHPKTGKLCFGFYAPHSHRLIPVTDCLLQPMQFGEILRRCELLLNTTEYRAIVPYDETNGSGILRHLYLRQGHHSREIMVCFVTAKDTPKIAALLQSLGQQLAGEFPEICSVMLNCNPRNTNVILGDKTRCLAGKDRIADTLCGVPVSLSPQSFYQVNTAQAERLFAEAKRLAAPQKHELLLDLYCGAGAIGLSMSDAAGKVIGVEIVPQAIEDAKHNAAYAGITNAEFYCGDAGQIAEKFAGDGIRPDIIVLDPPRKGCDAQTLDSCLQMAPARIVMISCNPATAARDAAFLCGQGYSLDVLRPADFFPRTGHVECVV